MLNYPQAISASLVANLIGWIAVFLIVGVLYVSRHARQRRSLLEFLGITPKTRQLRVYLSSFELTSGSVISLEGKPTLWSGIVGVSAEEFRIIPSIEKWVLPLTSQSTLFEYLRQKLSPSRIRPITIQVEYLASPRAVEDLDLSNCTALFIGGPLHNLGTKLYSSENRTVMQTDDERICVHVLKGRLAGHTLGPNIEAGSGHRPGFKHPGIDMAILEKVWDEERKCTVFIAAGTGTNGTLTAVHYFITQWEELERRYGNTPFSICLECPRRAEKPMGYLDRKVVLELPQSVS